MALAEAVAGSEEAFAQMMNREAQRMGHEEHEFVNSTGLPASAALHHRARSGRCSRPRSIRDYPEYYPLYAQKEYRYNNITQSNRNRLLWRDPTVDGMKTGHTESRGLLPDQLRPAR